MSKRVNFLFGFFSLFGLIGLNYFSTHDPSYLSYFAFFAFLANFFVARIDTSVLDERYYEDVRAAKAFAFDVAIVEVTIFFLINLIMSFVFPSSDSGTHFRWACGYMLRIIDHYLRNKTLQFGEALSRLSYGEVYM